jgi:hypothetical protein
VAELTNLETKLGEVTGLAMAAQVATKKVIKLAGDEHAELVPDLERMLADAEETERRCTTLVDGFEGKKTAILEEARSVKSKGATMLSTYLDDDSDVLDGFEFLTMAEAAEVGHWSVLRAMNQQAPNGEVGDLVEWALPIQQRHFDEALTGSTTLAAAEDPNETSS